MVTDSINEWVGKAKHSEHNDSSSSSSSGGVKVVRNKQPYKNRGAVIMAVADAIRPHLMKLFEGARDQDDMLAQAAHVRAFALNMAQRMVQAREQDNAAA